MIPKMLINVNDLWAAHPDSTPAPRPLFAVWVEAGFPSPAEDYVEKQLDLNEFLVPHPAATYFVRVKGDSMRGVGIFDGDMLVVDRSIEVRGNEIVVACVSGDLCVKRLVKRGEQIWLRSENPQYRPIEITAEMEAFVWGVVTSVIHKPE